ncbi:MAG: DNA polymerase III subunit alpha [Clostridia bacterium]|nr:DNA polymerase III subunit alpha [Clostridia bacterium]
MPKDFAHLHLHTEFSLLDGAIRIKKLFSRCKELGMSAVAITDHGNMYGAMTFYEAYKKFHDKNPDYAIKPIIGCEIYTVEDRFVKDSRLGKEKRNHLILLCKNVQGYHNLVKICSAGFTEGFYYKPRVDFSVIEKYHEGLICLSACVAGELPQAILSGDLKKADGVVKRFKKLFGDDYFVEIQDHGLKSQKTVLPYLISIAKENNVKIVATNDCHYLEKKDAITQKILQCISFGTQLSSEEFSQDKSLINDDGGIDDDSYFPTDEFYLKSREEMEATFQGLGDEPLDNTLLIASRCEDICADVFGKRELYPLYKTPDGSSSMDYLRRLTMEGLKKKFDVVTDEILQRANYELSIIQIKNFPDYFLVVWDYINYAESVGIPVGPGRGSGAGSLVAYAIGITKINPLQFDLYFERFLNPERVSNPDFDIDFCVDRREEVIDYVRNK